jgi:hypothetical protein
MNEHLLRTPLIFPAEKTLDDARRHHIAQYGSALVVNTWLTMYSVLVSVLLLVSLAAIWTLTQALAHQPVRIITLDALGRATAADDRTAATLQPADRERVLRFALSNFIALHFSRMRGTIQQDFPASLFFLAPGLVDASISADAQGRVIASFLADGAADDVSIDVKNVTFQELTAQPFRAAVDFDKVYISPGSHTERRRETYTAQVAFTVLETVPNAFVKVNPLGVQVTQLRIDQAFQ